MELFNQWMIIMIVYHYLAFIMTSHDLILEHVMGLSACVVVGVTIITNFVPAFIMMIKAVIKKVWAICQFLKKKFIGTP